MSQTQKRCGPRCGRVLAIATGTAYAAAAIGSVASVFSGPDEVQRLLWPASAAAAAQFGMIGALTLFGALINPAVLLTPAIITMGYVFAHYDSETPWLGAFAVSVAVLIFAYRRMGAGEALRSLAAPRIAAAAVATMSAVGGLIALQAPTQNAVWMRVREADRVKQISYVTDATCDSQRGAGEIDFGCREIIPARRARFVIGFSAVAVALGLAAAVGTARNAGERT